MEAKPTILLTGATGYIGGRLLKVLEKDNDPIRCLVRDPKRMEGRADPRTAIVKGDVFDKESLKKAMHGVDIAYYLVHSLASPNDFSEQDRVAASNFAEAASECHVKRIIYLGGLGDGQQNLSSHLQSRQEVGQVLREKGNEVQVLEFRASIVIGSGSLSFEMIRALCERLPIMITPKWVWTMAQPIAIADVLNYLKKAAMIPLKGNRIFEIGGKDQMSYGGIMQEYVRQRKLRRWFLPVPVLTPRLSSLWLKLITPLYAPVGRKLIESVRNPTVVRDDSAQYVFGIHPSTVEEGIRDALNNEDQEWISSHWSDAASSSYTGLNLSTRQKEHFGNRIVDQRQIEVSVPPERAFAPIQKLGGTTGWYYGNAIWRIRGFIDLLFGGVGLRRGRRDPHSLRVGDSLDFWRVEAVEPNRRLLIRAEMKLPGRAWLEFIVEPSKNGSLIHQTAMFDPLGLGGLLYWYVLYPIHYFIFRGMLKGIAEAAENKAKNKKMVKKT